MKLLHRSRWLVLLVPISIGLLIPIGMRLAWTMRPAQVVEPFILDKTVPDTSYVNHHAIHWLLQHEKYTTPSGDAFEAARDYYGFFPQSRRQYTTRDLEGYSSNRIQALAEQVDFAYFSDLYGVHRSEGYAFEGTTAYGYGGLQREELSFLQALQERDKLIIAEFNLVASPTRPYLREQAEQLFGFTWTGWVGRAFASLERSYPALPDWLPEQYQAQSGAPWSFSNPGFVLIHESGKLLVLEQGRHLAEPWPVLEPTPTAQTTYNLPAQTPYAYWFDVVIPHETYRTLATYRLQPTAAGAALLEANNLSSVFPAIVAAPQGAAPTFYFAGDFADTRPLEPRHAQLRGVDTFSSFLYTTDDPADRTRFFWTFYKPLVTTLLDQYIRGLEP